MRFSVLGFRSDIRIELQAPVVRHTSFVCLTGSSLATGFVCLTGSFLATGGFVKLFHKIPRFFHDYSGFFLQNPCFFHVVIFKVFHDFQSLWEPCVEPLADTSGVMQEHI